MSTVDPRLLQELAGLVAIPQVTADVARRLEAGAREYGDASLSKPHGELLQEVYEEFLDVIGWSLILLARMRTEPTTVPERELRGVVIRAAYYAEVIAAMQAHHGRAAG
jgi:hypothetical protein